MAHLPNLEPSFWSELTPERGHQGNKKKNNLESGEHRAFLSIRPFLDTFPGHVLFLFLSLRLHMRIVVVPNPDF